MSYQPEFWFPVKRYGFGWGMPVRWQGWVVLLVYFVLMGAVFYYWRPQRDGLVFGSAVLTLTGVLVVIVVAKGERPLRWRWGRK